MATNETRTLEEFGTTADASTETDDDLEPREECWCGDEELACFDHWRRERDARGEHR